MSQLGGPGADIPEMSSSNYSWPGLVVKSILVVVPIRRSLTSSCSSEPFHGLPLRERKRLQLQQLLWRLGADRGGVYGSATDPLGSGGQRRG